MRTLTLAGLAGTLTAAVWLAATNPTMDTYLQFVEARLSAEIDKMDQSGPRRDREEGGNPDHMPAFLKSDD